MQRFLETVSYGLLGYGLLKLRVVEKKSEAGSLRGATEVGGRQSPHISLNAMKRISGTKWGSVVLKEMVSLSRGRSWQDKRPLKEAEEERQQGKQLRLVGS
jgi:hypothetical protein